MIRPVFVAMLMTIPASAEPIVYSCQITPPAPEPDVMNSVDQVVIDVEAKTLELRVASTIGTSNEVNWIYGGGTYAGDEITMRITPAGVVTGAGLRDVAAFAFSMNEPAFVFSHVATSGATMQAWQCER